MTKEELKKEIDNFPEKPIQWRYGQFVFNYIDHFYGVARIVQFEYKIDCFYDDDKVDEFIEKCVEIINSNSECIEKYGIRALRNYRWR